MDAELVRFLRARLDADEHIRGRQSTVSIARDVAKFLRTRGFTG
jgi:hypothetical protein